jgi:hypothetical protein
MALDTRSSLDPRGIEGSILRSRFALSYVGQVEGLGMLESQTSNHEPVTMNQTPRTMNWRQPSSQPLPALRSQLRSAMSSVEWDRSEGVGNL